MALSLSASCTPTTKELEKERLANSVVDITWLDDLPPDLDEPLTLDRIIEIALSKNLELFIQKETYQLQEDLAEKARWALLPELTVNFTDSRRSNSPASYSIFLDPTKNTATKPIYSVGSPKHVQNWDFGFLWNVLDFGVSYFRARQQSDKVASAYYEYDRIRNSVILRAIGSYWRAVAAKQALDRANMLLPEMNAQTDKLMNEIDKRLYITKDQALGKVVFFLQREIEVRGFNDRNDSSDPTQGYGKEYEAALLDLAALMQLPPGAEFSVYVPEDDLPYEVKLPDLNDLFGIALANRPELYSKDLEYKVTADDVKIAFIQSFPSLQLFNQDNWSSNPFLYKNRWYQAGMRVAWNLFDLPQHFMDIKAGTDSEEKILRERLFLSQGILSQVSLAYIQYSQNVEQYVLAQKVAKASFAVADLDEMESKVGKKSKLEALQSKVNAYLALNNAGKIFAELQTNLEQLNNSLGLPRYFTTFKREPGEQEILPEVNETYEVQELISNEPNITPSEK